MSRDKKVFNLFFILAEPTVVRLRIFGGRLEILETLGILDSLERDFGCFEEIEFEVLELLKTMKLLKVGMLLGALFEGAVQA